MNDLLINVFDGPLYRKREGRLAYKSFFPELFIGFDEMGSFFEILFEYKTLIALFDFSPLLKLYFRLFMYLLFRLLFYK